MAVNQSAENKIKTVAGLTEALAYITNPAKIYEVSRINCSGSNSNTLEQFRLLRLAFNQNKGIIAHHFMVAPELLDNIKRSGIQFAYFKKGDKYNIVFLRKNETEIDQLLKQLRKEK